MPPDVPSDVKASVNQRQANIERAARDERLALALEAVCDSFLILAPHDTNARTYPAELRAHHARAASIWERYHNTVDDEAPVSPRPGGLPPVPPDIKPPTRRG